MKNMKQQKGFSLIELLIVVAIILIIAAIAVPDLLRSRMAANEASAAQTERTIATSNITYVTTYGIGFAPSLSDLGPLAGGGAATSAGADLIDTTLQSALKSGYTFTYTPDPAGGSVTTDPNNTYTAEATPSALSSTGVSNFCVDQTSVVRKDPTGTLAATTAGVNCDNPAAPGTYPPL